MNKRVGYRSISSAIKNGDRLDELKALQRRLAGVLDDEKTLARDIASISRRLIEVSREIASIEGDGPEVDNVVHADEKFRPEAI